MPKHEWIIGLCGVNPIVITYIISHVNLFLQYLSLCTNIKCFFNSKDKTIFL